MAYLDRVISTKTGEPIPLEAVESLAAPAPSGREAWRHNRGLVYLLVASVLLGVVCYRDIITPPENRNSAQLLSAFLTQVGFRSPVKGEVQSRNYPSTRVWVDLRKGVYYCPGDRRYGKSKGGQFASEADARLSQYEAAGHQPCR